VQDFGVGIPTSKQKSLFDPYFRIKEDGKNQAKGYGLGLPIVKRIVEAHGGKVWLESKKGRGSTFFFSLPIV
jgi:signal transduction histidine kinase